LRPSEKEPPQRLSGTFRYKSTPGYTHLTNITVWK